MKFDVSLLAVGALVLAGVVYWKVSDIGADSDEGSAVTEAATEAAPASPVTGDPTLWPEIKSPLPVDEALEARIAGLVAQMSLEEKVGQIMQVEIQYATPQDIRDFHVGSVLNGGGSLPGRLMAPTKYWLATA